MKGPRFTIFTPCYNGEHQIQRVFDSVKSQNYSDFEWIIINDGSTDNSDKIIKSLLKEYASLEDKIVYICQKNQGKHRSWNTALKIAKGELFVPADCDDSFVPETLDFFNDAWCKYGGEDISGINVCCYNPETGECVGSQYPKDGLVSNNIELDYKYGIQGEHWGCIRTDILKDRPFPEVKGHFFPENYLWYEIALSYKVVCFNKKLRAYFYEPTSLSNNFWQKFSKIETYNALLYYLWELKTIGKRVFVISPIKYLRLYYNIARSIIYFFISYIMWLFKTMVDFVWRVACPPPVFL